jgi:hypothetical protein
MVSPHNPGLPVLLAPAMGAAGWIGAKVTVAALAASLGGLLVWIAHRRLGAPLGAASIVVALFGASAPLAVYGSQIYPELPAALAVAVAVALLTGPATNTSRVAMVAVVVVLLVLSVKYAPVAAALAVAALWWQRTTTARSRALWCASLGVLGVAYALAHLRWYGGLTPYAAGSHFAAGELTVMGDSPDYASRTGRLVGLLVDRDFGIAVWQPAYLLALPAIGAVRALRPLLPALAAGWLTATFLALTMHGWWFPGRQVVIVLPIVVLAVAVWAAQDEWRRRLTIALGALGVSSALWLLVDIALTDRTLILDPFDTRAPALVAMQAITPDLTAGDSPLLALWTLAALLALALAHLALHRRRRDHAIGAAT